MLPVELQMMLMEAIVLDHPPVVHPTFRLPRIVDVSRGLRAIWIFVMSKRRSLAVIPFPTIPIPAPDFTEMGPPLLGWQQASPCAGLTPPAVNYKGIWAARPAVVQFEWEVAVWFQNTFELDVFEAVRAAQDLVTGERRDEEERGAVDATALGWKRKDWQMKMRGLDSNWLFGPDDGPYPFQWPEGYNDVRVDENGQLIRGLDGKPHVHLDPLKFGGDAWDALRNRPAVNGTCGIIFPPYTQAPLPPEVAYPSCTAALVFRSLSLMASYFGHGPGAPGSPSWILAGVTHVYIEWQDHLFTRSDGGYRYAYEAFEALAVSRERMPNLRVLQIHATATYAFTVDRPGIWSLLKVRGVEVVLLNGSGWADLALCRVIRQRLGWSAGDRTAPSSGWTPTGLENPGTVVWQRDIVGQSYGGKFHWLERYYLRSHDRVTVDARREQQRLASQMQREMAMDESE